nr:MAG TPA: hypothetical protein [Caudoviricetes sp.]
MSERNNKVGISSVIRTISEYSCIIRMTFTIIRIILYY